MPRAMAFLSAKKLVGATGDMTLGTPAERYKALSSLSLSISSSEVGRPIALKEELRLRRGSQADIQTDRGLKTQTDGCKPSYAGFSRMRAERLTQSDSPSNHSLIKDLKVAVEALRKELDVGHAARKKLYDEVVSLRRECQKASSTEALSWINSITEANQRKVRENDLQLVSQILLAAMDKTFGKQSWWLIAKEASRTPLHG